MNESMTTQVAVPDSATVYPEQGMIHTLIQVGAKSASVVVEVDGVETFEVDAPNARRFAAMLLNSADLLDRVVEIAEDAR